MDKLVFIAAFWIIFPVRYDIHKRVALYLDLLYPGKTKYPYDAPYSVAEANNPPHEYSVFFNISPPKSLLGDLIIY